MILFKRACAVALIACLIILTPAALADADDWAGESVRILPTADEGEARAVAAVKQSGKKKKNRANTAPTSEPSRPEADGELFAEDEPEIEVPAPQDEPEAEDPAPQDEPEAEVPAPQDEPEAEDPAPRDEPIYVERVTVRIDMDRCLFPGQQAEAEALIEPSDASNRRIEWSSSAPRLLSVDGNGVLRVKASAPVPKSGEYVDVWARATDGSFCMNCATVLVMPALKRFGFLTGDVTVLTSDSARRLGLPLEISPDTLSGYVPIAWESSDPDVVAVRAGGTNGEVGFITWGDAAGQARITASARGGEAMADTILITVESAASSIRLEAPEALSRGKSVRLNAVCLDAGGSPMPGVPVQWWLEQSAPGVTLDRDGNFAVDRFCDPVSVVVCCQALDAGGATARQTVRVIADIQQYRRFMTR